MLKMHNQVKFYFIFKTKATIVALIREILKPVHFMLSPLQRIIKAQYEKALLQLIQPLMKT